MQQAIFEYYSSIRRMLKWWRILIFLLVSVMLVFAFAERNDENMYMYMIGCVPVLSISAAPKINRLIYLLPGDKVSRTKYLLYSTLITFLLISIWVMSIFTINVIRGSLGIILALKMFFCEDLIFILWFCICLLGVGCSNQYKKLQTEFKKEKKTKISAISLTITYLCLCLPLIFLVFISNLISGFWYITAAVLSYFCYIPYLFHSYNNVKTMETNYENIKRPLNQL